MSLLALFGTGYNQLARMATAATPEAADALYPIANLYDGKPWQPFRFGAAGTSGYVDFDLNQVVNGGFETAFTAGVPGAGWTLAGAATATRVAAPAPPVGSYAMDVGGGYAASGANCAVFTVSVRSGEVLTLDAYLYAVGGGLNELASVYVRNLVTGNYYTSGWAAAPVAVLTHNAASWSAKTVTFTVESFATSLCDRVDLEIRCSGAGTGAQHAYYDEVRLYPRINFAGIFGHNIVPATAPVEIRSGTTSPGATVRATMTMAQPTMFSTFASVDQRYWRLFFTNDPPATATWLGELVLGQYETLSRSQSYPYSEDRMEPQDRSEGGIAAYLRSTSGARELQLRFDYRAADYTQAKEMLERSRNGAHPLVLADSSDSASAMLCRVADKWQGSVQSNVLRQSSLTFTELPFPTVLP
jgi:hypothetical protein